MVEFGAPPQKFFFDFWPKFKMPLELCCYLCSFSVTPQDRGGLFSYFLHSKKTLLLGFGNCTSSFPGYIGTKMLCTRKTHAKTRRGNNIITFKMSDWPTGPIDLYNKAITITNCYAVLLYYVMLYV